MALYLSDRVESNCLGFGLVSWWVLIVVCRDRVHPTFQIRIEYFFSVERATYLNIKECIYIWLFFNVVIKLILIINYFSKIILKYRKFIFISGSAWVRVSVCRNRLGFEIDDHFLSVLGWLQIAISSLVPTDYRSTVMETLVNRISSLILQKNYLVMHRDKLCIFYEFLWTQNVHWSAFIYTRINC